MDETQYQISIIDSMLLMVAALILADLFVCYIISLSQAIFGLFILALIAAREPTRDMIRYWVCKCGHEEAPK